MNALLLGADRVTQTSSSAASLVGYADKARLYDVWGYSSVEQYVQVHDKASVPADTAVPIAIIKVQADQHFSFSVPGGIPCNTGIVICNSSTAATKTIGGATCMFFAGYKAY